MNRYIYGAGGHGKVVLDAMQLGLVDCSGFIDDRAVGINAGLQVYSTSDIVANSAAYIHLAIGNCKIRERLAQTLREFSFFSVVHPNAVVAKSSKLGEGTFLAALAIIAPDSSVGCHCIINHSAVVDHDCHVGDFVHIAPHVALGGGVKVGKGVLVGSGAIVLPGLEIGDYATIGAGSIVTKNITAGTTVAGNPARILNKL